MGDLRPAVVATNSVLIVLSLSAIACRVGRKVLLKRPFSRHDALIMLASLFATIFSILLMVATRFGLGLPNSAVSRRDLRLVLKLVMIYRVFYFLCNWMVKASLLFFYTTLTIDRGARCFINVMQFIAFAFGMTCLFVTVLQCRPIHKVWDGASVQGKCASWPAFNYFNSSFMLATDVVLYAIFVWHLRVSRPQRVAVNMLFALGGFCLAASSVRIYFVHAQNTNPDFTRRNAMTIICAAVENHLAIIVACAPSIKVVLLHYLPSLQGDFEKYPDSEIRTTDLNFMTIDAQTGLNDHGNLPKVEKPQINRKTTEDSGKSGRYHDRKWWKPPTSWEVNQEGREEGDLESTTGTGR